MITIYEYEIKSAPNPEDPNEQPSGTTIIDDRLYGMDRIKFTTGAQSYNKGEFTKQKLSNTLTLSIVGQNFSVGQIIVLTGFQNL